MSASTAITVLCNVCKSDLGGGGGCSILNNSVGCITELDREAYLQPVAKGWWAANTSLIQPLTDQHQAHTTDRPVSG